MDVLTSINALIEKAGKLALPLLIAGSAMLLAKRYGYWPATDIPDREAAWIVIVTGISGAIVLLNCGQAIWEAVRSRTKRVRRKWAIDGRYESAPSRIRELNSLELQSILWMLSNNIYRIEGRMRDVPFGALTIKHFLRASYDHNHFDAVQYFEMAESLIQNRDTILDRFSSWEPAQRLGDRASPPWDAGNFRSGW